MDRREALKKLGLTFGFMVSAPGIIGTFRGFDTASSVSIEKWNPAFFEPEEFQLLKKTVDLIIPSTSGIPGAVEVGVPQFIDNYMNKVVGIEEQERTKEYMQRYKMIAENEDIEPILRRSLNISPQKEQEYYKHIDSYIESLQTEQPEKLIDDAAVYALLVNIRSLTIWSYKNSEEIGENVLAYDPVPSRQNGCVDVEEETKGRAWSL